MLKPIWEYKYVLHDWVDKEKLNWDMLSSNYGAIDLLKENPDKICFNQLMVNENAVKYIEKNMDNLNRCMLDLLSMNPSAIFLLEKYGIQWAWLAMNPAAVHIIEKNMDIVDRKNDWWLLNENPAGIPILLKNQSKIEWRFFSRNPSAIPYIEKNLDKVVWKGLSKNPNAVHILEKHPEKINWVTVSSNPNAINIISQNLDKINWQLLCSNPGAIEILEKNQDKLDYYYLSMNPNIFIDEYKIACKEHFRKNIFEDLVKKIFHPNNLPKLSGLGYDIYDDFDDEPV